MACGGSVGFLAHFPSRLPFHAVCCHFPSNCLKEAQVPQFHFQQIPSSTSDKSPVPLPSNSQSHFHQIPSSTSNSPVPLCIPPRFMYSLHRVATATKEILFARTTHNLFISIVAACSILLVVRVSGDDSCCCRCRLLLLLLLLLLLALLQNSSFSTCVVAEIIFVFFFFFFFFFLYCFV